MDRVEGVVEGRPETGSRQQKQQQQQQQQQQLQRWQRRQWQQQQQQPAISAKYCSEASQLGLLFSAMPAAAWVTIPTVLPKRVILRDPKPRSVAEAKRIIHGKNTPPQQRAICIMHWALGNPKLLVEVA